MQRKERIRAHFPVHDFFFRAHSFFFVILFVHGFILTRNAATNKNKCAEPRLLEKM